MLLKTLLPADTAVVELRQFPDADTLLPAEAALSQRFVRKRLLEFAAGRWCARTALREFSVIDFPILIGEQRQPLWPAGFTGSITHTDNYCAAVVAPQQSVSALGIDAEMVGRVGADLWPILFRAKELDGLNALSSAQQAVTAALLFSGKEAFFKCQFPLTGAWLDFRDVEMTVEDDSHFRVDVIGKIRSPHRYSGRYGLAQDGQLLFTTMVARQS
ncbi:MAG: 4'-phosphopantetheinyl transferase superfamily protein [Steroidobacteraceae bacterium]